MDKSSLKTIDENGSNNHKGDHFVRSRWCHAIELAEQLRHKTEIQKNEQLRQYAFDIPSSDDQHKSLTHADDIKSFENALLSAKTGNFNLDNLTEKFVDLKRTFNHMIELNKNDIIQITLSTTITKTALLIILRSIESIVEVMTKGTRKFPTLNSLISYIRSRQKELPIHGRLLVDWYNVAQILDLLINDPDWLVQPRKAHWAMKVCNETLTWARGVFNENYRNKSSKQAILDREDSVFYPEQKDKDKDKD
ncbi:unnamed protein product [Rotaria sp. Silwood1]|nr:unnamed protein product [Rotaria sp. Silwood1]CAF1596377.1 unnamed protein product [Rotaria sp. Silwood1]CAF3791200.1 unnamed protein product [Rotaria sp. Silwood1]CAF4583306.1 unnamed protein product [Rotaria sp. Silwood1]CAF4922280.1 unnamed protein product [Rotaria sp. Silwood1]